MSSPADDILVIKNGTLTDGTGGRPRPNVRIGIRGGKIAEVGPESPSDQGGGGGFIDAAGRFILPGLIDGACPSVDVPGRAARDRLSDERRILHAVGGPEPDADPPRGVHQRREWFVDVTLRAAVNSGMLQGPRISCAGLVLTPSGGIFAP
jgi:imidazolonepropionase-like amidohydrolase